MSNENKPGADRGSNGLPDTVNSFSLRNKPAIFGICTFIILACLTGNLVYQRYLIKKENKRDETRDVLFAAKERLQEQLMQSVSAAKILAFFIQPDGSVKDFDLVASQILAANPSIDALELVPDGVIKYISPLEGNKAALGYDILHDPLRNKEAYKAIQKKELLFAGPFNLKQGGVGVVGRLPVFRNNKFWGFSAVLIKTSTLLRSAGIDSTEEYYFQLSKINPDTGVEEFFISHPKELRRNNIVSVDVPNGEWKLSATRIDKHKGYFDILLLGISGVLFSIMCGWVVFMVTKRPEKLKQLVKKRTAELEQSKERYRTLIEKAPDGIIVYGVDGAIHQFNHAAHTEAGYTREEFATLNLNDLLVGKKIILDKDRASALKSGKANFQRKIVRKDGSVIDLEINASMLPDETLLAFIRNITERRRTEKALQESEEKFSKAFRSNLLAFAIYDEEGRVVDANERFAAIFETTLGTIVGKNSEESKILSRQTTEKIKEVRGGIMGGIAEKGSAQNHEASIQMNSGRIVYLLLSVEPLELTYKRHWLITAIDITEKKNAELSLAKNEMKYRSLIEQASDGIVISDLAGMIVEVNRSICAMGGYTVEEMVGKPVNNFLPPQDIKELPLRIDELVKGKTLLYERRMLRKNGVIIDVEVNSKMASGDTLIGFVRDITERKKAEEELKRSNERYELTAKATNDAILDHDFIKNKTIGNENFYNLFGFKQGIDRIDFESFKERLHPDERKQLNRDFQQAISGEAALIAEEIRFRTDDGDYKHLYTRAYIKYDDKGKPVRLVGTMQDISWRIKNRQKLLKEKELSDSIINNLPAIFYLFDQRGKFLRWNKNFETVTGYSSEEISKMHPLDLFAAPEKIIIAEKIGNVFISGKDSIEANFLLKNQKSIPYYFYGIKIEYEGEICLMGFGLDFSDKVQSDKLTKESEQKFRGLVEQASDGVAILSTEGFLQYVSPSIERILGYTESEIMQLNIAELAHPDDTAAISKVIQEVMQNPGVPIRGNIGRALHKNGNWRSLEFIFTNMLHLPSVNGIVENFRDITEELEAEKKIINEKYLSDSIINSLPGIFYLYDYNGKFIRWNKNFETVTGYSADEIRTMHPLDFYDEDLKPAVAQRIKDVFQKRMPNVEFLLTTKDRRRIPFLYNSIMINYEGVPCIAGMAFDVTERKKVDQELIISNRHLEQTALELKTSYNELERFAYIVSHDLQEPLRMISSFLKLLEQKYKSKLDETGAKYIHFAVDGAERMKQLIMDLLEYSRTGTHKDIPAETDMNTVMKEVLILFEHSIREQGAVVEYGELPVLAGTSKIQMFQLMQNLLSNALKYHSEKKLVIKIAAVEEIDRWIFSFRDNGIGIDPKFSDRIFIVFQRLHNKNEYSGTGIGLSICKKIVEKHGGKIWVQPAPDGGSIFYFSIPKRTSL